VKLLSYYASILSDERLIRLFEYLVKTGKDVLIPEYDPNHGHTYNDIIDVGIPHDHVFELISKIITLGLGKAEYYDQILRCPYCNSEHIRVYFYCPFCNSTQLYKELLIEHIRDGVIGPISKFKSQNGTLVCPSCGNKLITEGKDYRVVGVWYRCLACYRQTDLPKIMYRCRICKKEVTAHGLVISSISKIIINKSALEEFSRQHLAIRPIIEELKEMRFSVNSPGTLIGKSGTTHKFDIIGINDKGEIIAIDILTSTEPISETTIISTFVKALDVNVKKLIMITIPALTEGGKKLAQSYGINVLEGKTISEIITSLKSILIFSSP
jgi:transcription elongation factor Elf1